jgi:hypothetical protein
VFFVCLSEGKPIPTELRNEEAALREEIDLDDDNATGVHNSYLLWGFAALIINNLF